MRLEKLGISSCVVLTLGLEFLSARGSETRGLLSPDKPGGGGGVGLPVIWPIRGCAAGQCMVFVLSVLNRVYNFAQSLS